MPLRKEVTQWLLEWSNGDRAALDKLMPLVSDELHRLAHQYLRRERPGHTLQTTALVHEAYLELVDQRQVRSQNRAHFFGIAAHLMRRILVEYARRRAAAKRGGGQPRVTLSEEVVGTGEPVALVALDDALRTLAELDPQQCRIVELRFFGGLTVEETAELMGMSPRTIKREWRVAKAWLQRELEAARSQ
jgi:RNA polymerase sigma factor (TIGR02999 family)